MKQPTPRRWGTRQRLSAVVVAVATGGMGGAAIYAATAGTTHAMAGGIHGPMHGPPPPSGPAGRAGAPPGLDQAAGAGVVHSEAVVTDGDGGFTTKITQTGTVDAITLSSVVVRSDDGFTQIYEFPSANVVPNPSVSVNDTVTVQATRTGPTMTLSSIDKDPPKAN